MTTSTANPPAPTGLTDAELRALIYFGIGVGSEGSRSGRDVSNQLSFAGNIRNGVMEPVGNSGFSIGTLQTDLGQHPEVARSLVMAYQSWARTHHPDWVMTRAQETQTTADLARDGNAIRQQQGRQMDPTSKSRLDQFLASDAGITYVHNNDVAQVDKLMREVVPPLQRTELYRNASADDQARLVTVIAKAYNQSEVWGQRILNRTADTYTRADKYDSLEEVKQAVQDLPDGRDEYMRTGRDAALQGAEVFVALRNSDAGSPLRTVWNGVLENPLANPAQLDTATTRAGFAHEYVATKDLFLNKATAPALIAALDRGGAYGYDITNARGRVSPQSTRLYGMGNDFVVLDGDGHGKAQVDGRWSDVTRTDLVRTSRGNGVVELSTREGASTQPLLRIDPHAPELRPARAISTEPVAPAIPGVPARSSEIPRERERPQEAQGQGFPSNHRDYPLFETIHRQLPAGTSDAQAAHVMAQAKQNGIRDAHQLDRVAVVDGNAWVVGRTPGFLAKVDLSAPTPPLSESLRQSEQVDQQQSMERQQVAMSAPGMGGRGLA